MPPIAAKPAPAAAPVSSNASNNAAVGGGDKPGEHTVKKGENLSAIAKQHDVSMDAIMDANPRIQDPDAINQGQVLKIPQKSDVAAAGAAGQAVGSPEAAAATAAGEAGVAASGSASAPASGPRPMARPGGIAATAPKVDPSTLPLLVKGSRGSAVADLQQKLKDRGQYSGKIDGIFGPKTNEGVRAFQRAEGLKVDGKVGKNTWGAIGAGATGAAGGAAGTGAVGAAGGGAADTTGGAGAAGGAGVSGGAAASGDVPTLGKLPFEPNAQALASARNSAVGKRIATDTAKFKETYEQAAKLTGVPAEMIAAIHVNESNQGSYRKSTHGPESGFGLDDRFVSSRWGNQQLARHGLGTWERGTGSEKSVLQSAVIAAEHLKRQARTAGVEIGPNMSTGEIAGAVTSYIAGGGAGKRANERGSSWMLNTSDANPHPQHPGGTSRGPGGTTIRVKPSRKPGLLRWDTLLPLLQEQLKKP